MWGWLVGPWKFAGVVVDGLISDRGVAEDPAVDVAWNMVAVSRAICTE